MRLTAAIPFLFLSICFGCPRDNGQMRRNRGSTSQAELESLVPGNVTNFEVDYVSDSQGRELSLFSCDWAIPEQHLEAEALLKRQFNGAGWVPLEYDLDFLERPAVWAELPPEQAGAASDQRISVWWVDRESNVVEMSLFHWRTRTDGGPKYKIVLRYFTSQSIKKRLRRYSQRHGLPNS